MSVKYFFGWQDVKISCQHIHCYRSRSSNFIQNPFRFWRQWRQWQLCLDVMCSHPISFTLPILRPTLIRLCVDVGDRLPGETLHRFSPLPPGGIAAPWGFPPPLPLLTPLLLFLLLLSLFLPFSSCFLNFRGRRVAEPYTFICITWVNKAICLGTWDQWVALMPVSRLAGGDKRQHMCRRHHTDGALLREFHLRGLIRYETNSQPPWLFQLLCRAVIHVKLILWYGTRQLFVRAVISITSRRCLKHLRATVQQFRPHFSLHIQEYKWI